MKRLIALVGFAIVASPTLAQNRHDMPDRPVTRAEVIAQIKQNFDMLDANHDGVVTQAEFDAYRANAQPETGGGPFGHIGAHWFERADAKGDGRVTLAEAEARPLQMFDMADANKDGVVSVQERQAAMAMMSFGKH
jgi:Ca2+-binding EF-hand superfamily protein